ncbi:MAG: M67 family metallopeptidase [Candidatus Dormibacteria bacterium]
MEQPKLLFSAELFEHMRGFAEAAYPYEGCGVLVGTSGPATEVTEVVQGHNLVVDRRHDRYELDPRDIITAERAARARGEEVVGFYHTHPDHPARPSQFDTDRAWPGYHYVVIAVDGGRQRRARAWRLVEEVPSGHFEETELKISSPDGQDYNPPSLVAEPS